MSDEMKKAYKAAIKKWDVDALITSVKELGEMIANQNQVSGADTEYLQDMLTCCFEEYHARTHNS